MATITHLGTFPKVNNFRDRLMEMKLGEEVKNSYILQEIES